MFNFGLLGNGNSGDSIRVCWNPLVNTFGDNYGGTTTPTHTPDGILIYNEDFNKTTGLFTASFGDSGADKLVDIDMLIFNFNGEAVTLDWNITELDYRGTNGPLAIQLALEENNDVCFSVFAFHGSSLPIPKIWLDENINEWVDENTNHWIKI